MTRRLAVISSGVGSPSATRLLADQLADAVRAQVGARGEAVEVTTIEVRELASALATTMSAAGLPVAALEEAKQAVREADGLVAVTPVFAGSYAGLFKMFMDTFAPEDLADMPVVVAATAGTPRHSLVLEYALRPLFAYYRCVVVPTGVFAATEDFGADESATGLGARIQRAATELAALMVRESTGVEGFTPTGATSPREASRRSVRAGAPLTSRSFSELLAGHDGS